MYLQIDLLEKILSVFLINIKGNISMWKISLCAKTLDMTSLTLAVRVK